MHRWRIEYIRIASWLFSDGITPTHGRHARASTITVNWCTVEESGDEEGRKPHYRSIISTYFRRARLYARAPGLIVFPSDTAALNCFPRKLTFRLRRSSCA